VTLIYVLCTLRIRKFHDQFATSFLQSESIDNINNNLTIDIQLCYYSPQARAALRFTRHRRRSHYRFATSHTIVRKRARHSGSHSPTPSLFSTRRTIWKAFVATLRHSISQWQTWRRASAKSTSALVRAFVCVFFYYLFLYLLCVRLCVAATLRHSIMVLPALTRFLTITLQLYLNRPQVEPRCCIRRFAARGDTIVHYHTCAHTIFYLHTQAAS
jgi:hypothetical protein